jgi:L-ascorbate metabolism protein UlaG (beta-lactamase superfamily)
MEITYLGHSSFKLKGKKTSVVTDPYTSAKVGLKFPKTEADIVTISHQHEDHNAVSQVGGSPFVISEPGEYEVKGISIIGIPSYHDNVKGKERGKNTIYTIEVDGIHIVHLGDVGEMLSDKDVEMIGEVDILLVPVGGFYTITAKQASELIPTITAKQASELIPEISPKIVIPMHYGRPELLPELYGELTDLSTFLKLVGGEETAIKQAKLQITKDKLPDQMQVIVLES